MTMPTPITDQAFAEINRQGLAHFIKSSGIRKKDFAAQYPCRDNYLSRLLSGEKPLDILKFARAVHHFGYEPILVFGPPAAWSFKLAPTYDFQTPPPCPTPPSASETG